MPVPTNRVVVTSAVQDWLEGDLLRAVWIGGCLARHRNGDWGEVDPDDRAVNDHALRTRRGRLLSAYAVPAEIADTTTEPTVWVITDDLDTATTVLWPRDY